MIALLILRQMLFRMLKMLLCNPPQPLDRRSGVHISALERHLG